MKITGLPIEVSFGDQDDPNWKKQSDIPTGHDEDLDSEEADQDDKDAVNATLGFDASELFKDP